MAPRIRTVVEYLVFSLPVLIFFGAPALRPFWSSESSPKPYSSYNHIESLSFDSTAHSIDCPSHSFSTYVLSREPLVVYVDGFLSVLEADHIVNVA